MSYKRAAVKGALFIFLRKSARSVGDFLGSVEII